MLAQATLPTILAAHLSVIARCTRCHREMKLDLIAEVPGINESDLEVQVKGSTISLAGTNRLAILKRLEHSRADWNRVDSETSRIPNRV